VYGVPLLFGFLWEDMNRCQQECDSFIQGCTRVVKPGGSIAVVLTTPGWRLDHLRQDSISSTNSTRKGSLKDLLVPHGFSHQDVPLILDYGSVDEALSTYGFIYGQKAIDYLLDNQIYRLNWSLRIYSKRV
jgi:hypothetical protein